MDNLELWLAIALGISEALALIPSLKSNGLLDLAINLLKKLSKPKE